IFSNIIFDINIHFATNFKIKTNQVAIEKIKNVSYSPEKKSSLFLMCSFNDWFDYSKLTNKKRKTNGKSNTASLHEEIFSHHQKYQFGNFRKPNISNNLPKQLTSTSRKHIFLILESASG